MGPTSSPRQPGAGAGVARHAAFKVHRDSHSIHKATTSPPSSGSGSTNSSVSSSSNAAIITPRSSSHHRPAPTPAPQPPPPRRRQQQQQPVIIYTHSPKVIRTNPRDFMSIVQKLTGMDSHGGRGAPPPPQAGRVNSGSVVNAAAPQDESSSSSSESCANTTHAAGPFLPYADSSQLMPPPPAPPLDAHFMAAPDIPLLFAPDASASDHLQQLCAPRGFYSQFPPVVDAAAAIGPVMSTTMNSAAASNGGAVFSPSMVENVRTFSGYH